MTTLSSEIVLRIADRISENLAFRDSVDNLFSYIASLEETNIIIDFLGIKSITGSFAHQYVINKKKAIKHITERNIPLDVKKMFELVERRNSKPIEISTEPIEVLDVVSSS
ncbi:hypothetical protein C5S31_11270 [ANME-1 cluster archaeon GoMg2]|nr:hypothetical protein [ANME-1 cluster archaeon GoMg2]